VADIVPKIVPTTTAGRLVKWSSPNQEERRHDGSLRRRPGPRVVTLEEFLRTYLETVGGVWDEVEPQVYDVLVPGEDSGGVQRITFDPRCLAGTSGAQLASFGTPFIDRLLADAMRRGRRGRFYMVGLNLTPHDLAGRVRRALTLLPPLELLVERVRALHFTQIVFWFQAEFVSDQKEQEILPVAMDLHYGREVRHLEQLLDHSRLVQQPALPLPEARRGSVASAYPAAREQVLRSLGALAATRNRELSERLHRQIARMSRYYADLREELEEQRRRLRDRDEADDRLEARRAAIDREEQVRVAELRQKNTLRVHQRLIQVVVIQQPKLLIHARPQRRGRSRSNWNSSGTRCRKPWRRSPVRSVNGPTYSLALVLTAAWSAPRVRPGPPRFRLERNGIEKSVCAARLSVRASQCLAPSYAAPPRSIF